MPNPADDYLFLEALFIERIKEEVAGLVDVSGLPDLAGVTERQQHTPAVYVIYLGDGINDRPAGQGGGRRAQVVEQYWAVVLSVSVADPNGSGVEARREAGPILSNLIHAMTGWTPAGCTTPVSRAARQSPAQYQSGHAYYPIVFKTTFIFPRPCS